MMGRVEGGRRKQGGSADRIAWRYQGAASVWHRVAGSQLSDVHMLLKTRERIKKSNKKKK